MILNVLQSLIAAGVVDYNIKILSFIDYFHISFFKYSGSLIVNLYLNLEIVAEIGVFL